VSHQLPSNIKSKMPPKKTGSSNHFQTRDLSPVEILCRSVPKEWKIWECAAGSGRLVNYLEQLGYEVEGTDILAGFDFMSPLMAVPEFDMIITNPPFSLADEWLQRCYDLGKPFALLMPITKMGEQGRFKLFKKYGIQLVMLPERCEFVTPSGKEGGAWFYCAWFCHGLDLPSQIYFP